MKHLCFLVIFLLVQETLAIALTVADVKVSVTADSAAAAREQALTKAHTLAFQKLLKESFPESSPPAPPEDVLIDMVTNFSIDREKTTPQSYAASLTFQFDESRIQDWLRQDLASSEPAAPSFTKKETLIKITASYSTFADWQHIKKTLEHLPGIEKVKIITLSPQNAALEIAYTGEMPQLQQRLSQKELTLSPRGQDWEISSHGLPSRSQVIY